MPDAVDPPETDPARRPYDSTLRRQRAGETRERIVAAGSDLLRGSSIRDWRTVTSARWPSGPGQHEDGVPALRQRAAAARCRDAPARRRRASTSRPAARGRADVTTRSQEVAAHPLEAEHRSTRTAQAGQRVGRLLAAVAAHTALVGRARTGRRDVRRPWAVRPTTMVIDWQPSRPGGPRITWGSGCRGRRTIGREPPPRPASRPRASARDEPFPVDPFEISPPPRSTRRRCRRGSPDIAAR